MAQKIKETAFVETPALRLLRCRKTHRYFTGNGWTDDPSQAKHYPDEIDAARACVENDLQDVELVLRVPGTTTDLFTTPIR